MVDEMLHWSIDWGYIYIYILTFIVKLFLIWCLTFCFYFCSCNFKFGISSLEFVWEDGEAIVGISPS